MGSIAEKRTLKKRDRLKTAIVDYGMGNLFSVKQACSWAGLEPLITSDKGLIASSDALILPGVGAFSRAMANLKRLNLISPLRDFIASGKPFMGICLGMQLLMTESEEFGLHKGLGVIKGTARKFPANKGVKVPQIGWNGIRSISKKKSWKGTFLNGIRSGELMYFNHSYYCPLKDKAIGLSFTEYAGIRYFSSFLVNNIFACQFHPEKSAFEGLRIYKNWSALVKTRKNQ